MPPITIEAPAKINLHLQVGDRRPDGFHDIESLFLALAFGDTVCLEPLSGPPDSLEICMNWQPVGGKPAGKMPPTLPPEKNIVSRAVSVFRSRTGYDKGLKVTVEKRIPVGGGLGGGSSDAAAVLLALNRLAASDGAAPVSDTTLAEMGASVGSDIPFFVSGACAAWVSGRGECIQAVDLPEAIRGLSLVLVNPGFASDTAGAYHQLDIARGVNSGASSLRNVRDYFEKMPGEWPFVNDFLPVFQSDSEVGVAYQQIIACLRELGADFAGLSGSGSTCFGVFSEHNCAESSKGFLLKHWPLVIVTFPLAFRLQQCYNNK